MYLQCLTCFVLHHLYKPTSASGIEGSINRLDVKSLGLLMKHIWKWPEKNVRKNWKCGKFAWPSAWALMGLWMCKVFHSMLIHWFFSIVYSYIFFRSIVREVVGFLTFICIMYVITAGSRNPNSYRLQHQIKENFELKHRFHLVNTTDDWWNWTHHTLVDGGY